MRVIGLTGGIAMGKSTAASLFRRAHVPVFDADAAVHRLQGPGGAAVRPIEAAFPGAVAGGRVDRPVLRRMVLGAPERLKQLEQIVHPLVQREMRRFLARHRRAGARLVVLDVPLLLESARPPRLDCIAVVSAPQSVQLQRLRKRGALSEAQIKAILARQMKDAERRRKADIVVRTGLSRRHAQLQIERLIARYR